ncbi:MAG: RNA polymerase sigma-70 factor [Dehalococcoidia bacterium]
MKERIDGSAAAGADLQETEAVRTFAEHRELLFAIAYRMLGRAADAEDVVQDAWLRWANAEREAVRAPRAFLVRVTTRLAIDRLRRLKARRETYVGSWLPEPVLTGPDVAEEVELAESVSMALLVVLETLSPLERAVFVLHEVFALTYAEIGETLGRGEATVRQLGHRAQDHVHARHARYTTDQQMHQQVTERFLTACTTGDIPGLMSVLAPGVTLVADGGGRAPAPSRPIEGADKVARFLAAVIERELASGLRIVRMDVNGGPGFVAVSGTAPVATMTFDVADGRVQAIYLVANPDKLTAVRM